MIPSTTVIEVGTAREVFEKLFLDGPDSQVGNDSLDFCLYRGVSDARHELIPTALRADPRSIELFKSIACSSTIPSHPAFQHVAEWNVIRNYYLFANRNALPLPSLPPELQRYTIFGQDAPSRDQERPDFDSWPPAVIEPVLALAQHYGLPTRLLDWMTDPLVAVYFAAEGGMRHLEEPSTDQPTHVAIWSTTVRHLNFVSMLSGARNIPKIVYPPRSENPNLAAQRGLFTLCRQMANRQEGGQKVDRRPINEIVADELRIADPGEKDGWHHFFGEVGDEGQFFFKLTLPLPKSPRLLAMLQTRGYDAGRLFPGYGGAAKAAINAARITNLTWRT